MVGPPPPPPSSSALGPEPPLLPTLPQAASETSASATSSAGIARINFVVLFFTASSLVSGLRGALLRDLESFGCHAPLQRPEANLGDERQDRHRERASEQYGSVVELGALHDQFPEAAAADERRQSGARDHLHRRGADAGEDHRRRNRELYAGEDLAPRESHTARGVYDFGAHLPQAGRGVDKDRRYR